MSRKPIIQVKPDIFTSIQNSSSSIHFINSYHGVPVCYQGNVIEIETNSVTFSIPKPQLLCMRNDSFTLMNHPKLPALIRAEVIRINWKNEIAEMSNLQIIEGSAGKRILKRVETEQPIPAKLVMQKQREILRVEVTELSSGGLSFYIHRAFYKKRNLRVGKEIIVHYHLPDGRKGTIHENIAQRCIIKNILPGWGNQYYRIGVQNLNSTIQEPHILHYISQRQNSILKEISDICNREL